MSLEVRIRSFDFDYPSIIMESVHQSVDATVSLLYTLSPPTHLIFTTPS